MKYFKITNLTTGEEYYVSSSLPNESTTHVAMSQHLDTAYKWRVEEVRAIEFFGLGSSCRDPDTDDDWEDDDEGCECWD